MLFSVAEWFTFHVLNLIDNTPASPHVTWTVTTFPPLLFSIYLTLIFMGGIRLREVEQERKEQVRDLVFV